MHNIDTPPPDDVFAMLPGEDTVLRLDVTVDRSRSQEQLEVRNLPPLQGEMASRLTGALPPKPDFLETNVRSLLPEGGPVLAQDLQARRSDASNFSAAIRMARRRDPRHRFFP